MLMSGEILPELDLSKGRVAEAEAPTPATPLPYFAALLWYDEYCIHVLSENAEAEIMIGQLDARTKEDNIPTLATKKGQF